MCSENEAEKREEGSEGEGDMMVFHTHETSLQSFID
jgi:hypothetical protein